MRNTYCANPTSTPCLLLGYDDWAKLSHELCELTDVTIEVVTGLNNCNLFVFIANCHMDAFEGHGLQNSITVKTSAYTWMRVKNHHSLTPDLQTMVKVASGLVVIHNTLHLLDVLLVREESQMTVQPKSVA
nr:hypothetical protein [Enterobacter bugandensis]